MRLSNHSLVNIIVTLGVLFYTTQAINAISKGTITSSSTIITSSLVSNQGDSIIVKGKGVFTVSEISIKNELIGTLRYHILEESRQVLSKHLHKDLSAIPSSILINNVQGVVIELIDPPGGRFRFSAVSTKLANARIVLDKFDLDVNQMNEVSEELSTLFTVWARRSVKELGFRPNPRERLNRMIKAGAKR